MSRIIKASKLVQGRDPVTIAATWSVAGWEELAASSEEQPVRPWSPEEPTDDAQDAVSQDGDDQEESGTEGIDPELAARLALAEERASALIRSAEEEAGRLLDEAKTQASALLKEARETGYRDGYAEGERKGAQEGLAKAETEMEAAVTQAMKVLAAALHEKNEIVASSRDDVLKIIRKIAEKVIRAEVRLDPSVVERSVEASLRLVTERSQVLVRVNPDDVSRARDGVANFLRYFTPSAVVEVCADQRVTPGGCVIETNGGNVDAQLETQLEEVLGQLEERLYGG